MSVQVTPPSTQVVAGASAQLTATPADGNGNPLPGRAVTWSTGNSSIATVSATGMVSGLAPGSATITATSEGVRGTATISVVPGPAAQLTFTAQPAAATAGVPIAPSVQVTARDVRGNVATGFSGAVTLTLASNPGGATLTGTTTEIAVAGVATFSDVRLDRSAGGYTLRAASGALTAATSTAFTVSAAAAVSLDFTAVPATAQSGVPLTPPVQVTAYDAYGNVASGFTGTVTVALGANPGGATLSGTTTVSAAAGVATFTTLSLDVVAAGYTLQATASALTAATSGAFAVTPAPATQLTFTVQPGTTVAGAAITPAVQVTARDAAGNVATDFTGAITVSLGANPGGGALSGTTTVSASSGTATFSDLAIDRVGSGYTLQANAAGLTAATSAGFNITPGPATHVVFTVQPTTTIANVAIAPAVEVTARDAFGNVATGFAGNVTVAIGTNPGGGALTGTTTVAASAGVASFATLRIDKVGVGYTLAASAAGLTSATSAPFDITPAGAAELVFSVQPSNAVAGAALTPAVQVTARDAQGNTATGFTGNVTVAIGTNPGAGTLSGTTTVTAVAGIATFSDLRINRSGAGYTLTANAPGVPEAISAAFTITPGAATQLAFTTQPASVTAGAAITPAVQVTARDALGNTATTFSGNVTVALGANPGGGTLSGTTTVAAVAGVATFSNLSINRSGAGYTLTASASGLSGATSATFSVTAGPATVLVFTVQPTTAAAGAAISPAVQVTARDALGNTATGFTGNVTVAIGTNPGSGTLSGTTTVAAVAGVASFGNLSINRSGTGYTLTASASGLTGATSAPFDITPGAATQLTFTVQPSNTTAGATITPAVQVAARDALGNVVTGFTGNVTVAIGTNPGSGTLSGTTTVAAVGGVASFGNLSINRSGMGYTLTASATGLTGATSIAFNINPGAATQLAFTVQPTNATAGFAITPAVQVTARDALGNTATAFTGTVTVAIGANPGGGTLSGTTSVAAVAGVASFSTLSIDRTGAGYTLTASASGLTGATSTPFNIVAATAAQLVFTVQPSTTTAGATITPAVQVTARDAQGNTATDFTGSVTLAIGANPGGGTLSGTTTVTAVAGVATFANLSINRTGTGYTLAASAAGPTGATSTPFNITPGAATQLAFTVGPSSATAGATITPAVQVTARDALGNTATAFTGNVTVAIGANPGGGTLSGTTTVAAAAGVATFGNLSINAAGNGYTLTASATGLTGATSGGFNITPGSATQLVFTVPPSSTTAGATIAPAVQVTARDAQGNTATGFTGNVTVAIGANPGGGTLSGTTTVAAVSGVASFSTLSINRTGTGYTLTGSASGLTGATSAAFNITPGAATQLAFTVQPGNTTAGATITPAVQVTARDALGNTATGFTGNVTVAIGTNPAAGTLSGTTTVAAVAGVASFGTLSINAAGNGYTLTGSASGLTGATSAPFNINPGAATQLAFTVQPGNTTAGATITPAVRVTARDALGNTATGFTGNVTVAIGTNPASGTLSGTTTVAAVAGVATFANLSINAAGNGYTLTGSASGLTGATSAAFNITAGAATQLVFTVQPTSATAGATITPPVQVTARDAQGNTATGFTGNVTLAIGSNPGAGTLSGTTTVAAIAGVASFGNLSIDRSGTGYTLTASATGPTGATSAAFNINPGAATQLAFTAQPGNTTAGASITPAVQVTARDALGNAVTTFTGNVTVAIGANPGGGTLSGTTTVAAVAGVASFGNLSINRTGTGYTLTASASGLTGATSAAFNITPGAATQLAFTVPPGNTTAGVTITPAVQVTARDALGNTVTTFTGNVTVAIGANPGGGTLSGTTTVAAIAGVASFGNLSINRTGTGYTLTASATGLSGATSAAFNITPGAATQLVFSVEPSTATAGAAIAPAVQVTARDAQGNTATGFTGSVTVAIGANPGGGTLSGTTTVAAASGVATFSNLSINRPGTGYTLTASATGLAGATSAPFDIVPGAATQLVFTVQPSTATAGATITPPVEVTARDALGNTATAFTGNVTVAIGTNPSGGTLSGTKTVAAVAGVASFSTLSINNSGSGYTLTASASGLTAATSAAFDIVGASATLSTLTAATDTVGQCLVNCALGLDASRVTVTVRNASGTPMAGVPVVLSATSPDSVVFVNPGASGVTDASGVFQADFRSAQALTKTISATAGGITLVQTATVAVMPVLVGAGDIADCTLVSDDATANLLDSIPGVVFTAGDNVYPNGTSTEFTNCYDPTWGRHKARTRPTVGNREYNTPGATGYYDYFGTAANPLGGSGNTAGYYSFDIANWHIVALNSEVPMNAPSAQQIWLRADLNGRRNQCVIAIWHKPRYATNSSSASVDPLWRTVADSAVELVINGHSHMYERFVPMDADGNASATGTRLIIPGTGGINLNTSYSSDPPNSAVRDRFTHGVLRVVLYPNRYRWEFIPAPGFGAFTDSGTANCSS